MCDRLAIANVAVCLDSFATHSEQLSSESDARIRCSLILLEFKRVKSIVKVNFCLLNFVKEVKPNETKENMDILPPIGV